MNDLVSLIDENTAKKIDKTFGGDNTLRCLAKSVILNYDEDIKNQIVATLTQINKDEYDYIQEVFEGTIDSSFNVVPAKSGMEFWHNAPQIIVDGISYNDVNLYSRET
jgi:hypothetical protein